MIDFTSATKEEIIRELERKSQDTIKVYNPTSSDFEVKWNGYLWRFVGKGTDTGSGMGCTIVPRYIANHYIRNMCDVLINKESEKVLSAAKKKYTGNNWNQEEERLALRTNNPTLIEKYTRILWKGKMKDYGMDRPIVEEEKPSATDKAMHLSIIDKLEEEEFAPVKEAAPQQADYLNNIQDDTQGQNQ